MIRRLLLISALMLAFVAAQETRASAEEVVGVRPSLTSITPIADVLARPADFEGKTVRMEGVVTAVCTMRGCWMALASADAPNGRTVHFKVDDGVIVFPLSAKGKRATAQGVVERIAMNDVEGREAAAENAHQQKAAAPTLWQIKATGAAIY